MTSPADDIPDLERLMRNVLRTIMERGPHGTKWLARANGKIRTQVERAGETARRQRPDEVLRDSWEAAGLDEIKMVIRTWPDDLQQIWPSVAAADVDMDRLMAYRGKNLHAVGLPSAQVQHAEVTAIILRLRMAFEQLRRQLLNNAGEFWPFITSIQSNVAGLRWDRSALNFFDIPFKQATLIEGDLVTLEINAINTLGPPEDLRYRFASSWSKLGFTTESAWSFEVIRRKRLSFSVAVADVNHLDSADTKSFAINVRPSSDGTRP